MKIRYGRKAIARIAIAAVAGGIATSALAAPSSADTFDHRITVENCKKPWTQLCKTIPTWDANITLPTNVEVIADPTHCSDIIAHVLVDGREVAADVLGPGESTAEYRLPLGEHTVGVQAEGVDGGCNRGYLAAWGGTLRFRTFQPGGPIDAPNGS